jgi:hypothetical protein
MGLKFDRAEAELFPRALSASTSTVDFFGKKMSRVAVPIRKPNGGSNLVRDDQEGRRY